MLNTDAEGRLILADAIVRACEDSPDYLIETSTLTGAQRVALGDRTAGVMGTDDAAGPGGRRRRAGRRGHVADAAAGRAAPGLDSPVADIANVAGDRCGGMLVAGRVPARVRCRRACEWAHIDIAGPAYNNGRPWGYTPKGATAVPLRAILATLEDIAGAG